MNKILEEYIVKRGDILGKIAADAGISLRNLLKVNPQIKDPNKIMVGDEISIPGGSTPPRFDDDEEILQQTYEDKIIDFFGHFIVADMMPGSKKAKRTAEAMASELSSEYQQGNMSDEEGKQFFSGYAILKELSYSLGGKYGTQSSIERYLNYNEARPVEVKGYRVTKSDYDFFADAFRKVAMNNYGFRGNEQSLTGQPPEPEMMETKVVQVNKILKEYILKNTGEKFEETPFGQIVVDEINKAVAEIPEIKVALEYLAEQEDAELEASTRELGRSYATAALNRAREEMVQRLPEIVSQLVDELMDEMGSSE